VTVNEKFIPQYSIESYTRFYLQSNLVDALHVAENERRIYAMDCTRTPLTPGEGAERYRRLDDPAFARGVLAWLVDRPLAGFKPHGFAPYTDAFKALIDSRYSDQDIEVAEAIVEWRRVSAITTASALHNKVSVMVNPQTVAHRLRDANATVLGRGRMTTGDPPERIWCLDEPEHWKTASIAQLKAEFNKGWQHLRIV
jgi:hypothetical protein